MKKFLLLVVFASCGGDDDAAISPDATPDATADTARQVAASKTATTAAACLAIGDFYWEIGDAMGALGSGAVGTTYVASTIIPLASASKIVFGAFMVQLANGVLTETQKAALLMTSGYQGLNPIKCTVTPTLAGCLNAGMPGPNYEYLPAEVGTFHYDGAHDQFLTVTPTGEGGLGIGALTAAQFTTLVTDTLGIAPGFIFNSPQPAGGVQGSAAQFAIFLRAILSGQLALRDHLGESAVCTLPGADCPTAVASPSPYAWHYSYNHWVEDDADGDGAFSSAGAFGFYPWISADKTLYGIVVRQTAAGGGGIGSADCGRKIRTAWVTATPQG